MSCIYRVTRAHIGEEGRTKGKGSWAIAVGARPGPARTAGGPAVCSVHSDVMSHIASCLLYTQYRGVDTRKQETSQTRVETPHTLTHTDSDTHTRTQTEAHTPDSPAATAGPHRSHVHTPW